MLWKACFSAACSKPRSKQSKTGAEKGSSPQLTAGGAVFSSGQERQGLAGSSKPRPQEEGSGLSVKDEEAHKESAPADSTAGPGLANGEPMQQHAQLLLRVFDVEGLANLHPRRLQLLPQLVELMPAGGAHPHSGIGVYAAVERFWEQQDTHDTQSAVDERHSMLASFPLFLQPITATASAGTALGCDPTPAACGAALARQLQQQQQQNSSQPTSQATLQHASLTSVLQAVGSHVLRCAPATSAQAPPLPVVQSSSSNLLSNFSSSSGTIAQWGDGLRAAVHPAYHAASGGVLEPALVLEFNSTAPAAQAHMDSQQQPSGALRTYEAQPMPATFLKKSLPAHLAPMPHSCSATNLQSIPSSRRISLHRNHQQHHLSSSGDDIRASMLRLLAGGDVRSHHAGGSPTSSTPFRQLTSNSEVGSSGGNSSSKPAGGSDASHSGTLFRKPHSGLSSFANTLFGPAQQSPSLSQWDPKHANIGARPLSSSQVHGFAALCPASEPLTPRSAHAYDALAGQHKLQHISLDEWRSTRARLPYSPSVPSTSQFAHQRKGALQGRSSLNLDPGYHTMSAHTVIANSSLYAAHSPRASSARRSEESASFGSFLKPHSIRRSMENYGLPSLLEKQADVHHSEAQASSQRTSMQSLPPRSFSTRAAQSSSRGSVALQREASTPADMEVPPQARADVPLQHQAQDMDVLEGSSVARMTQPSSQTSRQSPQLTPLRNNSSFRASRTSGGTVVSIHARALAVLDEVPVIATLLDVTGHVLYQNAASKEYHGSTLLNAQQNERESGNVRKSSDFDALGAMLEMLLASNTDAVAELLHEVAEGFMWQRVLALRTPILPAESSFSRHKKLSNCSSFFGAGSAHQGEQQAPPPQAASEPLQSIPTQQQQWQQQQGHGDQGKPRPPLTRSTSFIQPRQQEDQAPQGAPLRESSPLAPQQPSTPSGKARPRRSVTFSGIVAGKAGEVTLSTGSALSAHQLHAGSVEMGPSAHGLASTQQQQTASDQEVQGPVAQLQACVPEVRPEKRKGRPSLLTADLQRAEQSAVGATEASPGHFSKTSSGRHCCKRVSHGRGRTSSRGMIGSRRRSSSTSSSRKRWSELRGRTHTGSWKLTRTGSKGGSRSRSRSRSASNYHASGSSRGSSRTRSPCSAHSSRSTPAQHKMRTVSAKASHMRRSSSADASIVRRSWHAGRRVRSGAHRAQTDSSHSSNNASSPSLLSMQGLCYQVAAGSKDWDQQAEGRVSVQGSSANQSPGSQANLVKTLSPEEDAEAQQLFASTNTLGRLSLPQTPYQPGRIVRTPSKLARAGTSFAAEDQGHASLDQTSPSDGAAVPKQQSTRTSSKPSFKPPLRRHGSAALLQSEGQQKSEGPSSSPCVSTSVSTRATRSGLAVEPSTRVLSLMQGTSSKAQELGSGDPRSRAVAGKETAESKGRVRRIKAVQAQGQKDAPRQESNELDVSVSDSFSKLPSRSSKFLQTLEPPSRTHTGSLQLEHPFLDCARSLQLEPCKSLPGTLKGPVSVLASGSQERGSQVSRLSGAGSYDCLMRLDANECQSVFAFAQPPQSGLSPQQHQALLREHCAQSSHLQLEPGPSPPASDQSRVLSKSAAATTEDKPTRTGAEQQAQLPQHKLQLRVLHEGVTDTSDSSYGTPLIDRLGTDRLDTGVESVAPASVEAPAIHGDVATEAIAQNREAERGSMGSKAVAEEVGNRESATECAAPELPLPPAVPSGMRRLSQTISWGPRTDAQEQQQAQPQHQLHPGLLGEGAQQFLAQQSRGRAASAAESEGSLRHQLSERMGAEDSMGNLFNVPSYGAPPAEGLSWHEVQAMAITDPVSGHAALLLLQTDITQRAELEARMAALTESQLSMLEQMFPRHVLEYMVAQQPNQATDTATTASHLASSHKDVTILFTDIVGFTTMSKQVKPDQVMAYLNELFTAFDELVDTYQIYKVETAGDCYIAAGGLMMIDNDGFMCIDPSPDPKEAAERVLSFAKALLHCAKSVSMPHNGEPTTIRVGMHTGPAVTGLIGTKLPKFSVFGDTMNTCSRMESTCRYGCIQISETTNALLRDPGFKPTGGVEVKGKGCMNTFYWDPSEQKPEVAVPPEVAEAVACVKDAAPYGLIGADPMHAAPSRMVTRSGTNSGLHATSVTTPRRGSMLTLHYCGEPSAPEVSELLSSNTVSVSSPQVPYVLPEVSSTAAGAAGATTCDSPTRPPSPKLHNLTSLPQPHAPDSTHANSTMSSATPTPHQPHPTSTRSPPPVRTQPSLHLKGSELRNSGTADAPLASPLMSPLLRCACSTLNHRRHSHTPLSSQDDMAPSLRSLAHRRGSELSLLNRTPSGTHAHQNRGLGGPSMSCDAGMLVPPASPPLHSRHHQQLRHAHVLPGSSQQQTNAYARLALLKHQSMSSSSTSQPVTGHSSTQPSTPQTSLSAALHPQASQQAPSNPSQAQHWWLPEASYSTQSPPPISRTPSPALPPSAAMGTHNLSPTHAATQPALSHPATISRTPSPALPPSAAMGTHNLSPTHAATQPALTQPATISRTPSPALPPSAAMGTHNFGPTHAAIQLALTQPATSHTQLSAPSTSSVQNTQRMAVQDTHRLAVPAATTVADQQGQRSLSSVHDTHRMAAVPAPALVANQATNQGQGHRPETSSETGAAVPRGKYGEIVGAGPAGPQAEAPEAAGAGAGASDYQLPQQQGMGAQQGSLLPPLSEQGDTVPGQGQPQPQPQQYSASPRFRRPPRRQASCFASLVPALQQEAALQKASAAYVGPPPWQAPGPNAAGPPPLRTNTQALRAHAPPGTLPDPLSEIRTSSSFTHQSPHARNDGSSTAPAAASHTPSGHPTTGFASALAQFGHRSGRRSSAGAWHALAFSDAVHGANARGCGQAGHSHNPWSVREAPE